MAFHWTAEEDEILRVSYQTCPIEEIAGRVGRSVGAVRSRGKSLRLSRRQDVELPRLRRDSKWCCECGQEKPLDHFYKKASAYDGRENTCGGCTRRLRRLWCKTERGKQQQRDYARRYYVKHRAARRLLGTANYHRLREKRRALMAAVKADGCSICGETRPSCLLFHHLGEKKATISALQTNRAILRELSRCALLCGNCHMLLHAGDLVGKDLKPIEVSRFAHWGKDGRVRASDQAAA